MSITDEVLSAIKNAVATTIYDAHIPEKPGEHYVVVYPDLGLLSSPTLCADLSASTITFRLVYVSNSRSNVEAICRPIRTAILNRRFTDGTWTAEFDPDDYHNTTPVTWDETVPDRSILYATDEFKALAHK